ncbi:MAG: cysteine desulfurase [Endomicrobia bacterium]|nr:cysteine desulfurase [Endomicrobiia bacterium]MDW8056407.1 cysteine desulfurase family protein [Elusimicrobiota bacterium]
MKVYLDNHSGTKLDPEVLEAMLPYLTEHYGNAQSLHDLGTKSKEALETARAQVAGLINCLPQEIIFTSCGSEANNLAIKGTASAYREYGRHIIVSAVEHLSVLYSVKRLNQLLGIEYTVVPVDKYGVVDLVEFGKSLREDTFLVSIQLANPEIGTIQPIKKIAEIIKEFNQQKKNKQIKTLLHTDAVAACGIVPVDVKELEVDLLSLSASQFYGPKGVAALYVRKGVRIVPQIDGGIQENGYRAGTENVACIVGLGKAAEIAYKQLQQNYQKMLNLRDKMIKEIQKKIEYVYLNGHPDNRLPNNVNFSFEFIEGESILLLLNQKGIYVSSGSACTSKALKLSHVLEAIGIDPAVGQGSVVFTLSKYNTEEEIDYVLEQLPQVVERLRSYSPLYSHFIKTGQRMQAGPGTEYDDEEHTDIK